MNPMSVQIKARVTLPALIHAFIGAKHPLLATGMQSVRPPPSPPPFAT